VSTWPVRGPLNMFVGPLHSVAIRNNVLPSLPPKRARERVPGCRRAVAGRDSSPHGLRLGARVATCGEGVGSGLGFHAPVMGDSYAGGTCLPPATPYALDLHARPRGVVTVLIAAVMLVIPEVPAIGASDTAASVVIIVSKTSPVSPGEYARLQVRVRPTTVVCRIGVFYNTTKSEAKGLGPRRARSGTVTWRWKVGSNTTPGRWRIQVDCGEAGKVVTTMRVR
jgi:hypothetical protein